jgi:hypothetical protein
MRKDSGITMLTADTIVDVGVGSAAFVGLVVEVGKERATIHMDGTMKIGSRVVIRSDNYKVNATAKTCAPVEDSFAICFEISPDQDATGSFEWPHHARVLIAAA